jgi:hypothetical protein
MLKLIEYHERKIKIYEEPWVHVYQVHIPAKIHLWLQQNWKDIEKYAEEHIALFMKSLPKINKDSLLMIFHTRDGALWYINTESLTNDFFKDADKYILVNWEIEKV